MSRKRFGMSDERFITSAALAKLSRKLLLQLLHLPVHFRGIEGRIAGKKVRRASQFLLVSLQCGYHQAGIAGTLIVTVSP
jgi:hypothetical protein